MKKLLFLTALVFAVAFAAQDCQAVQSRDKSSKADKGSSKRGRKSGDRKARPCNATPGCDGTIVQECNKCHQKPVRKGKASATADESSDSSNAA
jgi:hypothetical protein